MPSRGVRPELGITCESVAEALPAIVDGLMTADLDMRRHVEACLRCQAELAQYRKLRERLLPMPGEEKARAV